MVGLERQLGGDVEVTVGRLDPYYFTGVEVENLVVHLRQNDTTTPLISIDRGHGRVSIISALMGRPRLKATIRMGDGSIHLSGRQSADMVDLDLDLNDVDLGSFGFFKTRWGVDLHSRIDGEISLKLDRQKWTRSTGKADLTLSDVSLKESQVLIGEFPIPLPAVTLAHGGGSKMSIGMDKGVIAVDAFRLGGGDLGLDVKGKVFLSPEVENYRLNLSGSFTASKKLSDALPFLFIVDKQKRPDGSYPLVLTGRFAKPTVKIGTFTVPL